MAVYEEQKIKKIDTMPSYHIADYNRVIACL